MKTGFSSRSSLALVIFFQLLVLSVLSSDFDFNLGLMEANLLLFLVNSIVFVMSIFIRNKFKNSFYGFLSLVSLLFLIALMVTSQRVKFPKVDNLQILQTLNSEASK